MLLLLALALISLPLWYADCGQSADVACLDDQVCEVTSLQRLVLSTVQGSWGSEHIRRRSVDLQARPRPHIS